MVFEYTTLNNSIGVVTTVCISVSLQLTSVLRVRSAGRGHGSVNHRRRRIATECPFDCDG